METVSVKAESAELHDHEDVCAWCLSRGRTLAAPPPALRALIANALTECSSARTSAPGVICWECSAVLRKMERLRMRAALAQQWLTQARAYTLLPVPYKESLSSLKSAVKTAYDTEICHQEFPYVEVELKRDLTKHDVWSDDDAFFDTAHQDYFGDGKGVEVKCEPIKIELEPAVVKTEKVKVKKSRTVKMAVTKEQNKDNDTGKKMKTQEMFKTLRMSEEEMRRHRDTDRSKSTFVKSAHRCDTCIMSFTTAELLKHHHRKRHSQESGRHVCAVCATRFLTADALRAHAARHYERYQCNLCKLNTRRKQSIFIHYNSKHNDSVECGECQRVFGSHKELSQHRQQLHWNFTCDTCGQNFLSRRTIEKHIRSRHAPFACAECGVVLKTRRALQGHRYRSHARHGSSADAYCVECDKQFRHYVAYRNHVKDVHTSKPQFPCPECGKTFRRRMFLSNHLDFVHRNQSKFHCDRCDKVFQRREGLRRHVMHFHDRMPLPKNKVCEDCGRAFQSNIILANHRRTHTGERPFACQLCTSTFTQKVALQSHVKNIHLQLRRNK